MSRLTDANVALAREIIARYPKKKSALIPLVHLSQEQNGYVTEEAMRHVAELVDVTPAEVYGTATFYEMFRFEPTGKYLINICGTMSCALMGAHELMHHAEHVLGVKAGSTTADGLITLQHAECQAACTEAPTLQVNYRYRFRVTADDFDQLVDDLRAGRLEGEIPPHGTLGRNRQHIPADKAVGAVAPRPGRRRPGVDRGHTGMTAHAVSVPVGGRVLPGRPAAGRHLPVPVRRRPHARPLPRHRWLRRAAQGAHDVARRRQRGGQEVDAARARRGRLPGRHQVGLHTAGRVAALSRRQRRRVRARHLQGPPADGVRSASADRGLPDRLLRRRPESVLPLHPR